MKVTPEGRTSVVAKLNVGVGRPVATTGKLPGVPMVKVTLFALVIAGACVPGGGPLAVVSVRYPAQEEQTPLDRQL